MLNAALNVAVLARSEVMAREWHMIPAPGRAAPAVTFNSNVTMNFNVFHAATALDGELSGADRRRRDQKSSSSDGSNETVNGLSASISASRLVPALTIGSAT